MIDESFARSPDLLSARESLLFVMDMQEKLLPHIHGNHAVLENCSRLIAAAKECRVPLAITEQYPNGLGQTVPAIHDLTLDAGAPAVTRAEKLRFSGADAVGWPAGGERTDGRQQVVLAGIETHICILQTALDLLTRGYRVFIVADAVGSRRRSDHEIALQRLRDCGVFLTTAESILFEWCETAESERFKPVRDLVAKSP